MIGILSSNDMEGEYAEKLHYLFREVRSEFDKGMIVFTINNIDLRENFAVGTIISEERLRRDKIQLPEVIFNFSLQRDIEGIKARKALEEMDKIKLVNYINKFDQWMIMNIMSACKKTKKYLLPYYLYDKAERNFRPKDEIKYITMPSRGASLSRVIYAEPDPDTDIIRGTQYFKNGHICDYIDASMCQKRWLFIEVPDLILYNNNPVIIRVYVQKNTTKSWRLLTRRIYPQIKLEEELSYEVVDTAALNIIEELNKFLPSLGHGFIDFILSKEGKPFFLHLGGLDQYFFKQEQDVEVYKRFYKNILSLSRSIRTT
ncbi:hypothetical protein [Clostridium thermarum]|uniref:hypothetical protein n=1 Tax=Clostridium thermarum TaxID=1716543 RepID=UPI0013D84F98|nr:hypothetical protein [Clostridium thermarum]